MNDLGIVTGAILVELNLTNFGITRKLVSGASAIAQQCGNKEVFTGSNDSTTRSSKYIIPKSLYEEIAKFQRETRKEHSEYTAGMRWTKNKDIMSTKMFSGGSTYMKPYSQWHSDRAMALDSLAHDFAYKIYPLAKTAAENDLGSLFDADDYAEPDEVYESIGMNVNIDPISKGEDFRCSLDSVSQDKLTKEFDERLLKVQKQSIVKLVTTLGNKLKHLSSSIKEGKVIHNKTIGDLHKFADSMPAMDFTNDVALKKLADRVVLEITGLGSLDKDLLRDSEDNKSQVMKSATDISNNLDAYVDTI